LQKGKELAHIRLEKRRGKREWRERGPIGREDGRKKEVENLRKTGYE